MSHATGAELTNAIRHRYRAVASRHHLAGVGPVHMESQAINARAYIAAQRVKWIQAMQSPRRAYFKNMRV